MQNWKIALKDRLEEEFIKTSQEWIDINVSTAGLLNITLISNCFLEASFSERKDRIIEIVNEIKSPVSLGFLSLYTCQEADELQIQAPISSVSSSVRTWQDLAQWAENPQNQSQTQSLNGVQSPRTVTFYSYKGGVGRTTALTHVAWVLARRGRKVVAVDLDLEAPGLSTAFNLTPKPVYGIIDYFYERAFLPEGMANNISVTQIFGEVRIPDATGRLFVVPAGNLDFDYLSKVDDLQTTRVIGDDGNLWSVFKDEISEQLKPDILLVDSRTGINQWGALSLLQAADEVVLFLFPNEQNLLEIDLLIEALKSLKRYSINFVFTPVPDTAEAGAVKVRNIWSSLQEKIDRVEGKLQDEDCEATSEDNDNSDVLSKIEEYEPLIIPYIPSIALADSYPVTSLLEYYARIANLIDEETDELQRSKILSEPEHRWDIIESLSFPEVNAADPKQNLALLFQRTTDFERFLDNTTCLIRGRKGTGKTALYWLLLKHFELARKLAYGRLDDVICFSGHGRFHESRPSRDEFKVVQSALESEEASWEAFWRAYLLLRAYQSELFKFLRGNRGKKFIRLKEIISGLPVHDWRLEHTNALIRLSTEPELILVSKDALNILDDCIAKKDKIAWFLYDDLDEDFASQYDVRKQALTGLFRFLQSCDARRIKSIRFKIFLREDIWSRLIFDNKSHFNGRDLLLQWTRIDFLRLALRLALHSQKFKELAIQLSPVESIDQATEEAINRALELLWGSRRRRGSKAKYVSRWVYERLTDSSNTTFPRSLSILLAGAKEQELSYKDRSSIKAPIDRLLRGKSLEFGLREASEERCSAVKEEYPDLLEFLETLKGVPALVEKQQLQHLWEISVSEQIPAFDDFVEFISEVGIIEWRAKDERFRFADIYVHGFEMSRTGAI
ncbi:P-loop ATPase, Sll1717 family [Synechococcus sp. PCC 7336]|uniref:MinD/ParA family ATP-binding protein n=1 Tax=Synechococcus sp. PCC 7336 TaxID=195250 RepID=UPI0003466250|nr:AAA family ATPase [Synechococcus sp. PCC 7336]